MAADYRSGSFLRNFWRGAGTLVKIMAKEHEMYRLLAIGAGPVGTTAAVHGAPRANML
jgi:hypothetical protein